MDITSGKYEDYSLFFRFFVTHSIGGFQGIDKSDPLLAELDYRMGINRQLFYVSDPVLLKILFISDGVKTMFGMDPSAVSPGFFLTTTHQEDLQRHHMARAKLISVAQEIFIRKSGTKIISTNVRGKIPGTSDYADYLYQCFIFYSKIPYESAFLILVITDISGLMKVHKGFHYYIGNDPDVFRFPDEKLLSTGSIFSHAEFKILELVEQGLSSKEIAKKLNRSVFTINTHRSNINKKSGRPSNIEVIHDLKEMGLL